MRLVWLDNLRLIAGVSMIGLHATSDSWGQPFVNFDPVDRIGPMLIRTLVYTARTELFVIISIFLLFMALDRRPRPYGITIQEQSKRLLLPFAFWVVFYAAYNLIKAHAFDYEASVLSEMSEFETWLGYFILGDVKYHMHFIPTLFCLVLMFPVYKIGISHPWVGLSVLMFLVLKRELDVQAWTHFSNEPFFDYAVRGIKVLTYAGYGVVAASFYGLWKSFSGTRVFKDFVPLVVMLGVLVLGVKGIGTYKTIQTGEWQYGYTAGFYADFLMPIVLFGLAMILGYKVWSPLLSKWAPFSFGIYLCHPIFLDAAEIFLQGNDLAPITQVIIKIGFALMMTTGFVLCLSKSATLAWTVGLGPLPKFKTHFGFQV